ncbi:uroporphyrinogen-III C-methyltransferase [Paraglaciecola sp.]|uniref:uroporphyrinogen-III C-methyltransferase n=1 Tax=Paraglaciecola sp. TaxID=1920173 RepID=UPI003EF4300A
MADSQDKLTPADQQTLADLEKQLAKEKNSSSTTKGAAKKVTSNSSTSSNNTKKPNATTSRPASSKSSSASPVKTGLLWLFTVINLLLLAGVIGAGYWVWMQWQGQTQQQSQVLAKQDSAIHNQQEQVNQTLAATQEIGGQLAQQNQTLQSNVESLSTELEGVTSQVSTNKQNLADVTGRRPSDWLLAEADYLVRMAGRKLWLENDVKTSRMMLESADIRLEDLNDPSLLPIREKLANDIQSLQQINPVSIDSVALQVGALVNQVNNLPLAFFKKPESVQVTNNTEAVNDWRTNLANNWQQVTQNFFSVKRKTAEIKPFMTDQEQWLSKQQLSFALLQAQVAVLRENQTLYRQFLETALFVSQEYFDLEENNVQQFIQSLIALQNIDINKVYPEQFSAVPLLQDTIALRLDNRFKPAPQVATDITTNPENLSEETAEQVEPVTEANPL